MFWFFSPVKFFKDVLEVLHGLLPYFTALENRLLMTVDIWTWSSRWVSIWFCTCRSITGNFLPCSRIKASTNSRIAPLLCVYAADEYLISSHSQRTQSQLTLRKSFRETTSTSKGEFDVDLNIRHFRCMISGSVRSGEIFVEIKYPDGKTFKKLTINPSADINFSQSISIKEGKAKRYTGSWSYVIKANKAEGNYMVQIMTN